MKALFTILSLLNFLTGFSQEELKVQEDLKLILVYKDQKGVFSPVLEMKNKNKVGFIYNQFPPQASVRICNDHPVYVWSNGELILKTDGCQTFSPALFAKYTKDTSILVMLTTYPKFSNFSFDLLSSEKQQIIKNISLTRTTNSSSDEFVVLALLIILLAILAISATTSTNWRLILSSPTSKNNLVVVSARSQLLILTAVSFFLAFLFTYFISVKNIYGGSTYYLMSLWIENFLYVFIFIFLKVLVIICLSGVFSLQNYRQSFLQDYLLFHYFLLVIIIFICVLLWALGFKGGFYQGFNLPWMISLLYTSWFIYKFNFKISSNKLIPIIYICALELIPSFFIYESGLNF